MVKSATAPGVTTEPKAVAYLVGIWTEQSISEPRQWQQQLEDDEAENAAVNAEAQRAVVMLHAESIYRSGARCARPRLPRNLEFLLYMLRISLCRRLERHTLCFSSRRTCSSSCYLCSGYRCSFLLHRKARLEEDERKMSGKEKVKLHPVDCDIGTPSVKRRDQITSRSARHIGRLSSIY